LGGSPGFVGAVGEIGVNRETCLVLQIQIHFDANIVMARGVTSCGESGSHFNIKSGFQIEIL